MFSVIIPTLWNSDAIYENMENMLSYRGIGEVIVIDNNPGSENKKKGRIPTSKKIKVKKMGENIYVNPAWNMGVEVSKFENICICNDDVVFDIEKTISFLEDIKMDEYGIIASELMEESRAGKVSLERVENVNSVTFEVFFISKKKYKKIPNEIKIWFGDDWLFEKTKDNFKIKNINLRGESSVSVKKKSRSVDEDRWAWEVYVNPRMRAEESRLPKEIAEYLFSIKGALKHARWRAGIRTRIQRILE